MPILIRSADTGCPAATQRQRRFGPKFGGDLARHDAAVGVLDDDLGHAAIEALTLDGAACRAHALTYSWDACADLFLSRLAVTGKAAA